MSVSKKENLQSALENKVYGRLAPDGELYNTSHTELAVFRELTFTFNQDLQYFEADLTVRKNPRIRSAYEQEYAPGRRNHSIAKLEFTELGKRLGISFDEKSDFHGKLIVSDETSMTALADAGLAVNLSLKGIASNFLRKQRTSSPNLIPESEQKNPDISKLVSAFFILQDLINLAYHTHIEGALDSDFLVIRANVKPRFEDKIEFLNFFNNLTNTFSCSPDHLTNASYTFEDLLSQKVCDTAIASLRDIIANSMNLGVREASRDLVEETNLISLIRKVFKKEALVKIDPNENNITITFLGTKDLDTILQTLQPFTDNTISPCTNRMSACRNSTKFSYTTTTVFSAHFLDNLKQGLELSAVVFIESYDPVQAPRSGGRIHLEAKEQSCFFYNPVQPPLETAPASINLLGLGS